MAERIELRAGIWVVRDFFDAATCAAHIESSESQGYAFAPITTAMGPVTAPDVRNNTRVMIDDPAMAATLWDDLSPYTPETINDCTAAGLNERFRYYRYDPEERFDWHYDGYYERPDGSERSQLTFMVYLNDGFAGGETCFDGATVVPERGMALLFRHRQRHQGATVREGRKYVLRSDVMYSAPAYQPIPWQTVRSQ
jgi:hypothetical protein